MEDPGDKFGCWKVLNRAEDTIDACGTKRVVMTMICDHCKNIFDISSRYLRRKRTVPIDCVNCKKQTKHNATLNPYNKKGFSGVVTHVDDGEGFPVCGSKSIYGHKFSDDPTCRTCVKITGDD